jgi:hypothetical protein
MNLAFPAQANTAALNQTAAGHNANGLMAGLLAFFAKSASPAEANVAAANVVAKDSNAAPSGLIARLFESADSRQRRADEAYLAEAVDLYELEFRSREIDRRARRSNAW